MRAYVLSFIIVLTAVELSAQQVIMHHKLSENLRNRSTSQPLTYLIAVSDTQVSKILRNRPGTTIMRTLPEYNLMYVHGSGLHMDAAFLNHPAVKFIDLLRIPREEKAIDGFDPGTNLIAYAHRKFPEINGDGTVVSIKEKLPDSNDIDFKGRIFSYPAGASSMTTHATNIATMIAGGGNSDRTSRGVAWGASITSSDFINLIPDPVADYFRFNISVQNHSYGTGIENYYGADAAAYDKSVTDKPDLLHVFSSGNSSDKHASTGTYQNISGFANLTGSFKMSKNTLSVGAIDSFYHVETLSSRGPAHDGRLKPELVAYGHDGSSGAAAVVSGAALLLQQAYKEKHSNAMPAALVKAILINTAEDVGNPGIDYASGYGSVNVAAAIGTVVNENYYSATVTGGTTDSREIIVPAGTNRLSITLAYTDPPAAPNATKTLINDLDLFVTNLNTGITWRPWVLNTVPDRDSLQQPAVRTKDTLNNVEQVSIELPEPGTYTITVAGYNVSGIQPFSITYNAVPENKLFFTYPTSLNPVVTGSGIVLRWSSSFENETGTLEASINGSEWKLENAVVDLHKKYFHYSIPDTTGWMLFRITAAGKTFISDTITMSGIIRPGTAFHCADSAMLSWNGVEADNYRVYRLGEKYLEPFGSTMDTFFLVKNLHGSDYFAVVPIVSNSREGQRSYAFDYSAQGAGCYVNTFLADNINDEGLLTIQLGTIFNIKSLIIEKFTGSTFVQWKTLPVGNYNYLVRDSLLTTGINAYRLRIELANQQIIYSPIASLFHFSDKEFIVYPNPVKQNGLLTLASRDPDDVQLLIYNAMGGLLKEIKITDIRQQIPVTTLPQGIYFYKILKKDQPTVTGRFIIQ